MQLRENNFRFWILSHVPSLLIRRKKQTYTTLKGGGRSVWSFFLVLKVLLQECWDVGRGWEIAGTVVDGINWRRWQQLRLLCSWCLLQYVWRKKPAHDPMKAKHPLVPLTPDWSKLDQLCECSSWECSPASWCSNVATVYLSICVLFHQQATWWMPKYFSSAVTQI